MFAYKVQILYCSFLVSYFNICHRDIHLIEKSQGACDTIKHTLFTLTVVSRLTHIT